MVMELLRVYAVGFLAVTSGHCHQVLRCANQTLYDVYLMRGNNVNILNTWLLSVPKGYFTPLFLNSPTNVLRYSSEP